MLTGNFSPAELSSIFNDIGQELSAEPDSGSTLRALSRIAVERVPGALHSGITVGRQGNKFETVAATDATVERTDAIQYELESGPCVDAIIENTTFNAADLRSDDRWPEFGRRAAREVGVVSMLSIRLYTESDLGLIAGLNMYSDQSGAFDAASETIGVLLATHGALAVGRASAQDKADNLLIALKNSREIGIAMGILMAHSKVTRDQAFDLLRIVSQHSHRKVADLATEIADTGKLPKLPDAR
jgi:hypothetical protein